MSGGPSIAAALIVRDEARFIAGCLEQLSGRVDEIVVVDTGSVDATREICLEAGVCLLDHVWQGDFAAARNAGLEAVTCDWVLYIDADERLVLPDERSLSAHLDPEAIAATVRFRPKTGYTRYREIRLFRADPRIRFRGAIHEAVVPDIRAVVQAEGRPVVCTQVGIDHLGYDGDQSHKHARNLPLLQAAVERAPERAYYWYHLAETYAAIEQREAAERAARRACEVADGDPTGRQNAEASLATHLLVRLRLEAGESADDVVAKGLARVPDDHALWFLRARDCLDRGAPGEALAIARRLRAVDPDDLQDGLIAFEAAIFRDKACELAGLAALRLGDRGAAARHYAEAAALAPDVPVYAWKAAALAAGSART